MNPEASLAAVDRFRDACEREPAVQAAFLGGSFAAGTADEVSDLDLYVLTTREQYDEFYARRRDFMSAWGELVFFDETRDFEGFGFDMLHFVMADGVWGEVALGHPGNMYELHGGPYRTLVDKTGLLDGVSFPMYSPGEDEWRAQTERALSWFWIHCLGLLQRIARNRAVGGAEHLCTLRGDCWKLLEAAEHFGVEGDVAGWRARMAETVTGWVPAQVLESASLLSSLHREVGGAVADRLELAYPAELASVVESELRTHTSAR